MVAVEESRQLGAGTFAFLQLARSSRAVESQFVTWRTMRRYRLNLNRVA